MDSFEVVAADVELLDSSHLVEEMGAATSSVDVFTVLLGNSVARFHDVDGGYHRSGGYHVVNLIHRVQGRGSPPPSHEPVGAHAEAHIGDTYFYLEVGGEYNLGAYPDDDYVCSLQVTGYEQGPYSFADELMQNIDKRHQEYEYDG
jgi:hypothetical protein